MKTNTINMISRFLIIVFTICILDNAQGKDRIQSKRQDNTKTLTFFAFDDINIPWKKNLTLKMVKPEKHPNNPLLKRGEQGSIDDWAVQYYGSVIQDKGKFRMWYVAGNTQDLQAIKTGKGFAMHPAYAESKDGINWEKPNLGLVEYNGNKNNNLVKLDRKDIECIHLIVIHEPNDKPEKRYKMLLTVAAHLGIGEGKGIGSTTISLFSPDGFTWESAAETRFEKGYLVEKDLQLPPINFEQGGVYKWNGIYYLAGQVFSPTVWQPDGKPVGRIMTLLRSRDLVKWDSLLSYSFIRNGMSSKIVPEGHGEEAHLTAATWDRGNVILGVFGLWHGAKKWENRSMDLGLLISSDGINFREPIADNVFIPRGKEGEWDQGGLIQGQGFANVDDKTYIWYGAWDMTKPSYPPRGGVGLVVLERDRFGYLASNKIQETSSLETRIIKKDEIVGSQIKLYLNVDGASKENPIRVELVDEFGVPIPSYSGENASTVSQNGLYQNVEWKKNDYAKIDTNFSIKISFPQDSNVKLYAMYINTGLNKTIQNP